MEGLGAVGGAQCGIGGYCDSEESGTFDGGGDEGDVTGDIGGGLE